MKNMKTAIYCILFGLMMAVLSCSAIKMAKSNIKNPDPLVMQQDNLSPVQQVQPMFVVPVSKTTPLRPDFKPFRDSLINGMKNIREAVERGNNKMDSSLYNSYLLLQGQSDAYKLLISQQNKIEALQLDTARLYRITKVTTEIKQDADFGNTTKKFFVYCLSFVAIGITIIMAMVVYSHNNLSKNIKKLIHKHAA